MKLRCHVASWAMSCALAILPAMLVHAGPAIAASCKSLSSELSRLQSTAGRSSSGSQKWQSAKRQQQKALTAAERDLGYLGCSTASNAQCKALTKKVKRMRSNLAAIDRQLTKSGGAPAGTKKRIRQIQAALKRQGCGAKPATRKASVKPDTGDAPRSFLARLFNPQQANKKRETAAEVTARSNSGSGRKRLRLPSGGTFRTLCVRTCDGYFFPVSFSTGKRQFANDAARCTEICPASETELYVYKNPGGDSTKMMSLAGTLYTDQPFAYRYKTEFVEGCSCRQAGQSKSRSAWTELKAGTHSKSRIFFADISSGMPSASTSTTVRAFDGAVSDLPSPLARIPLTKDQLPFYEDPDTLANMEKGFDVTASLSKVFKRLEKSVASNSQSTPTGELPLLRSQRAAGDGGLETASIPPVFKPDDPGFRPAPDRDVPVRVVGPEFFVAQ
ncbi:DUF2865 domain-containing protein [Labrenzia sp. PHM005]|uniref:DUF2865 domain-containing protein n=1 Tax=Labrenzia sp. PHM005 TaxID=2590016 RepID=UPI001AD8EC75|nr:DUF2865 domain-containing protein [Labrenzia sp. PHM005]